MLIRTLLGSVLSLAVAVSAASPAPAQARLSDNARAHLLAGMPAGTAESEARAIENDRGWRAAAAHGSLASFWNQETFAAIGRGAARNRLSPSSVRTIREFAAAELPEAYDETRRALYLFGGPDFPYPNAFFPKLEELALVGLEGVGELPDVEAEARAGRLPGLMREIMEAYYYLPYDSYFITAKMATMLQRFGISTMLAVGIVATGNEIEAVERIALDANGGVIPSEGRGPAPGVRIRYRKPDGTAAAVIYLRHDLSNASLAKAPRLEKFLRGEKFDTAFYKAASFVSHHVDQFSRIDDLVLGSARFVVQTDDGLPFRLFTRDPSRWKIRLFGYYAPAPRIFGGTHQRDLMNEYVLDVCRTGDKTAARDFGRLWGGANLCAEFSRSRNLMASEWGGLLPFPYGYDSMIAPVDRSLRPSTSNLLYAIAQ